MKIEIDGAYAGITFSACHFIPRHDKCERLHGHSYIVRLMLHGVIGDNGMLMDFVELKRVLRDIAEELDHRVLLPGGSDLVELDIGDQVIARLERKMYTFPKEDVVILDVIQTTAEEIARVVLEMLLIRLDIPANVHAIDVGIDEERGQTAWASRRLAP